LFAAEVAVAQDHSVARLWNEEALHAIRGDFARPTVHARNLFHLSTVMYDAWAVYDNEASTYFLGNVLNGNLCSFNGVPEPSNVEAAREMAMSYAAYRLLRHRFQNSPGVLEAYARFDQLMLDLGYDAEYDLTDYQNGFPAALGNYLAGCIINYGWIDGSNEANNYSNIFYEPVNDPLTPEYAGNPTIENPNAWQPLALDIFVDQSGNEVPGGITLALSPEWGSVFPFALKEEDLNIYNKNGDEYWVYHDPGPPPLMDFNAPPEESENYRWGFELTSIWSCHLDATDGVMWDISPGTLGNIDYFPESYDDYPEFYDRINGGDASVGHAVNPSTGLPYEPNFVPRGDYTRVLAEFWADGPDSETPPGHWFTILNYVSDHPDFEKRFRGQGDILDDLEWDVKAYLCLGGAMHDAAISAWGAKGYYDYIRPISAIRMLADRGQASISTWPNYDPHGIHLVDNFIELVYAGDPLQGENGENINKIKLYCWRGPDYIEDPDNDEAGVGWILAEDWWPYQRPTFVTPPFAGYVSGHSTFSRAAAEVMTLLTGDEYFPGGMGEFEVEANNFLVFEEGPSTSFTLQWATYRDASDQTSLSRIWGGIHPPQDDLPGRLIGLQVGLDAFAYAESYFYADEDQDGFTANEDCDDNNPFVNPGATEIPNNAIDEDCDGIAFIIDNDMDGFNSAVDCDDNDSAINPGTDEIPNNEVDENCDGIALVIDADSDGFNSDEDCDDNNPGINPDENEVPNNNLDEDCDGYVWIIDEDMDGFNSFYDCNDNDPTINPDAAEIPNNALDENCDGVVYIIDIDGDGFNSDEDCDDNNPNINPDAEDIANNGIDEDCDGNSFAIDDDFDGFNSSIDCDDTDPNINPIAVEVPNNDIDENCDGVALVIDVDTDGYNSDEDCDDYNPNINPAAVEIANNGIDEDCDGSDLNLIGMEDINQFAFELFPNPAKSNLTLIVENNTAIQISIYNLSGQLVKSLFEDNYQNNIQINIEDLIEGSYFIQIIDEDNLVSNQRFIKF